jgi:hypothetical protein
MKDLIVKNHSSFNLVELSNINNIESTLKKTTEQLTCSWWISAGSAIGLYRDGDFIPNDTDIDVGVRSKYGQQHIELEGLKLIRTMDWRNRPIQTAYIDDNGCIFDIYYYYDDLVEDKLVTVSEYGFVHEKKGFIIKPNFGIKKLPTKYGMLPFLDPIEEYLVDRFGQDWKTPKSSKGKYIHLDL